MASTTEQHDDEMVPDGLARDFVRALRRVEDDGELDDMVATNTDERVVLEWSAQARLHDGKSTTIDGVSVLDLGNGDLTGFRTYYDTAAFVSSPPARTASPS